MTAVQYTARVALVAGHTIGQTYDIDLTNILAGRAPSRKRKGKTHVSLSGKTQHIAHRVEEYFQCSTVPLSDADLLPLQEFLRSVEWGAQFLFDETGTVAVPVNPVLSILSGDAGQSLVSKLPLWRLSFKVRTL